MIKITCDCGHTAEYDESEIHSHRLMCGDSTSVTDVEKLMDGRKADLVFTDPPYGMKKENDGVANDNLNFDDLLDFNRQWIPLSFAMLKDNGSWYCWGIDEPLMDIYSNILKPMQKENKITFRNLITWDKGNGQGQMSEDFRMYPIADEKCLFVMCGVQGFSTNADNFFEKWKPIVDYLEEQNYVTYLGTIVNIPRTQFDRKMTASGYVIYKDKQGNQYIVYAPYNKGSINVNDLLSDGK